MPSKWENCFFQHNYIPTFEVIMGLVVGTGYSPLGLVIFVALERIFVCFSRDVYFKFCSLQDRSLLTNNIVNL